MQVQNHIVGAANIELQNLAFQVLGSDPGSNWEGRFYYNSALDAPRWWDGAAFTNKATDSLLLGGQNSAFHLARANHTGTQLAATISDFDTQVRTNRLDQMAAPTAAVSFNGQVVSNVAAPTTGTDAANKSYVDATSAGRDWKDSGRLATAAALTANTRSGNILTASANGALGNIDGVAPALNDRVLVVNEATGANNGLYFVSDLGSAGTPWTLTRTTDADTSAEVTPGMTVPIEEGTANGDKRMILTTNGPITLNTTALAFTTDAGESITAGSGLTKTGSTIDAIAGATAGAAGPGGGLVANANDLVIDKDVVARRGASNLTGAGTQFVIAHGIGHADLAGVSVRKISTGEVEYPKVVVDTTNITIDFITAPGTNTYRVAWAG